MSTIRETYRRLVAALHPDRASSPEDAQRRTELMQRANTAKATSNVEALAALEAEVFGNPKPPDATLPRAEDVNIWTLKRAVLTDQGWICPPW